MSHLALLIFYTNLSMNVQRNLGTHINNLYSGKYLIIYVISIYSISKYSQNSYILHKKYFIRHTCIVMNISCSQSMYTNPCLHECSMNNSPHLTLIIEYVKTPPVISHAILKYFLHLSLVLQDMLVYPQDLTLVPLQKRILKYLINEQPSRKFCITKVLV